MRRLLGGLVRACHPEATVAVTLVAGAYALAVGRGTGTAAVAAAVLAGQLSVGWSNDYLDRDRDRRAGRADKPVAAGAVPPGLLRRAALAALVAALALSVLSGWRATLAHAVALAAAWAYNLGIKGTLASPVPYAVAFGLLPAFVVLGLPGTPVPPLEVSAAAALLGVGAHFANVVPDVRDDLAAGVRGLPQRVGSEWCRRVAGLLLFTASVVLVVAPRGRPGALPLAGLLVAALVVVAGAAAPGRWPFLAALAVAVLDVALLIGSGADLARSR